MNGMILIPAYNSAPTLSGVLKKLEAYPDLKICVIDDGSTDDTARIATSCGIQLIRHDRNRGKGAALQTGFAHALEQGAGYVITHDADEQHPSEFIPAFIDLHEKHPAAVILGIRKRDRNMPPIRKISNSLSALLISLRIRRRIDDVQCGFRLIPRAYLTWHLSGIPGFIFESEALIALGKNGVDFKFIPIPTIYPVNDQSKMTYLDSAFGFIFMYIASFFRSYKQENYDRQ